ncbi:putative subunit 4 of splicing factor 3B [Hamiltosporidium tvaerminnensis]|uniref:Putative subunit 4 of splicing factor 3B n=1 Tax=Hamiltosporidium tvaerminnensis TaxID=1176355 RepID=A0A4Q9L2U6_9MICR|nr:putative subunit 4 of splicing factor 3B [Hamiltosporidium tvaerminnensis]
MIKNEMKINKTKTNTIYVTNVDTNITYLVLHELFTQTGKIKNLKYPTDKITLKHLGYCYVQYFTEEDCDYTIKILNFIKLNGLSIKIHKIMNKNYTKLFVGNINSEVDETNLFDIFSNFGTPIDVRIIRDENFKSKGYGFITGNEEFCKNCIENLNGKIIFDKVITVCLAKEN